MWYIMEKFIIEVGLELSLGSKITLWSNVLLINCNIESQNKRIQIYCSFNILKLIFLF